MNAALVVYRPASTRPYQAVIYSDSGQPIATRSARKMSELRAVIKHWPAQVGGLVFERQP